MNQEFLGIGVLIPFELLLPVLGLLLSNSESPINSLIYRSFLGSIAALIYAALGAPDVALTEVMVGTLLSSLIYIVTIRSCYTVVVLVNQNLLPSAQLRSALVCIFDELHLRVVYQHEDLSVASDSNFKILASSTLSGSPHLMFDGETLFFEAEILMQDVLSTEAFRALEQPCPVAIVPSNS